MKVGFLQFTPVFGNKERNFKEVEKLLKNTKNSLIVLPELFNTGYTFTSKEEIKKLAEPALSFTSQFLHNLCKSNNLAIIGGIVERAGSRFFNSAIFVTKKGLSGVYRKVHLFMHEKRWFEPGNGPFNPFIFNRTKIGILICFDWIYPEAMRTLALNGADIVCHCANLVMPFCQDAMITRSIENRVYIITANRTGSEKRGKYKFSFTGQSQIVAPGGKVLVRAPAQGEMVKFLEINPELARNKKVNPFNDLFTDRRPDLYFR